MDFRDHLSPLRHWEDVLSHKADTQRLVGRLVCLFCSGETLLLARVQQSEKLIKPGSRLCRRHHVERLRSQWLRKTSLLPYALSAIECIGAQYDIAVFVHVQHRRRQNLCGLLD